MTNRNEDLPRVSSLIRFISSDEFEAIPSHILSAAAQRGTEKHEIIEKGYGNDSDNLIARMFKEGLEKICPTGPPVGFEFEKQLNGSRFTGKPDFLIGSSLIDYKFSNDLRPQTALQLVLYGLLEYELQNMCVTDFYAFHFPKDHGLFIYKIPDRAVSPLMDFAEYVIKNHEEIDGGGMERYEALTKWEKLLQDYDVFEPVATVLPPLTITNEEEAITAAVLFNHIKQVIDYGDKIKRELLRYMEEGGLTKIGDVSGHGVRMQTRESKAFDKDLKAAAKAVYDKALKECQTGVFETKSLVRFGPKKIK